MTNGPGFSEFLRCFIRIGLLSFGGPAAQIAVMHRELVETRGWMKEAEFLSALSFCMMLPGPEAMQLVTYSGWQLRGVRGGIIAGLLFVLPGAVVMLALAAAYVSFGDLPATDALFTGIKAVVVVIVLQALIRLSRKALDRADQWALAVLAFLLITLLDVPFPLIVLGAGLYGAVSAKSSVGNLAERPTSTRAATKRPRATHLPRTLAIWGSLWAAPLVVAWAAGWDRVLAIGIFFSKLAVVTFGGAYAVLAYMSQEVVDKHKWLTTEAMIDGLGLAETTPGPLILVTEFVGFLAASGPELNLFQGVLGALLVLWVTFTPCFLWIFAGAPYITWAAEQPRLSAALRAITCAVVGVIAALSYWFAQHVYFGTVSDFSFGVLRLTVPDLQSFVPATAALSLLAALLILALNRGLILSMALVCLAALTISGIDALDLFSWR